MPDLMRLRKVPLEHAVSEFLCFDPCLSANGVGAILFYLHHNDRRIYKIHLQRGAISGGQNEEGGTRERVLHAAADNRGHDNRAWCSPLLAACHAK